MSESLETSTPREPREPGWSLAAQAWRRRPLALALALVATATVVALRLGWSTALPAYLVLCAAGVTLAAIDVRTLRLPDAVLLPAGGVVLAVLGVAALADGTGGAFLRAVLAAAAGFGIFLVLALVNPSGLGLGDVKLAAVLGLALGHLGWEAAFVGLLAAFVLMSAVGVVLLALRRVTRSSALPFGPFMLLGALLALVADPLGGAGTF